MSTGRVFWIIWCSLWAGVWAVTAVVLLGDPVLHSSVGWKVLTSLFAAGSLAAMALPVGKGSPGP